MSDTQRVVVFHEWYGCDTGCCGHQAVLYEGTREVARGPFDFGHPMNETHLAFATQVADRAFLGVPLDLVWTLMGMVAFGMLAR